MDNRDRNIIDKFLDGYEDYNNKKIVYKRVYERPSKFKTIVGFIFSFGFFIILITHFLLKPFYFILLVGDILALIYYSINLFTKKGFSLPKTIMVEEENKEDNKGDDEQDEYWN